MTYNHYNLNIESDFEIRVVHENSLDIDLLIPLNFRSLDFSFTKSQGLPLNKIQFPRVYGLMIRIAKADANNYGTIHILNSIDLLSSIANFQLDYLALTLLLKNKEFYCEFTIF